MAAVFPTGNYDTEPTILSDTSETTIYTCNLSWAFITDLWFADDAGAARTVTVIMRRSNTDYTLVYQGAIPTNEPLRYEGRPIALKNGDSIKATASAGGVHCFVTRSEGGRQGG